MVLFKKNPHPRACSLILEQKGREGERERERNTDVREKHGLVASDRGPTLQPRHVP